MNQTVKINSFDQKLNPKNYLNPSPFIGKYDFLSITENNF